ncbi:hypothetical protein H3Z85_16785 [Chryseobacterium indologenes]|uniref:hypothetical protein n=1 Tax=Chryseobacterium TaxID=59732 RepID=UPI0004BB3ACF|nr:MULTISPECIES: hypothetical protein [Chryseobacterium]MBU3047514.1 hypothetical protein [Chryseobacterium indologenes]MEB4759217.1 hypothetical protein [Chryseobacterium indologenes]QPQ51001.1 hypothetical protein H3Z85_16785 [Chryseobacterium indologenes]QQQ71375.1 hypothetical protein JHW31_01220 [Chryseobacterium indologenes]UDQ52983.1 hypothetical protein LJF28_16255 [Chryseobacterium indologenes]
MKRTSVPDQQTTGHYCLSRTMVDAQGTQADQLLMKCLAYIKTKSQEYRGRYF